MSSQIFRRLSLAVLSLTLPLVSSCGHGPKVKLCTSDPSISGFHCHDENKNTDSILLYSDSAGLVAYSEADMQILLNACTGVSPKPLEPVVTRCVSMPSLSGFTCASGTGVAYQDSVNYIGLSTTDERTLLTYCFSNPAQLLEW